MAGGALLFVNLCAGDHIRLIRRYLRRRVRQLIQVGMQPHARKRPLKRDGRRRSGYRGVPGREIDVNGTGNQQDSQQNP